MCSQIDSKEVYPVRAFFGRDKQSDANEFLHQFVQGAIASINFCVDNENIIISLYCLACDTPAKAFVLYLKGHTGYNSCTKCNINGKYSRQKKKKNNKNQKRRGRVCFT